MGVTREADVKLNPFFFKESSKSQLGIIYSCTSQQCRSWQINSPFPQMGNWGLEYLTNKLRILNAKMPFFLFYSMLRI